MKITSPIFKNGDSKIRNNYRGLTIHKLYPKILEERRPIQFGETIGKMTSEETNKSTCAS